MRFALAGEYRELPGQDVLEPGTSPSTGRPLRRVGLEFVVGQELIAQLDEQLRQASADRYSRRTSITDEDGGRWAVRDWNYSYRDSGAATFAVELEEIEVLQATRLRFGGLDVEVEYYSEKDARDADEPRVIEAEFVLDAAATLQLNDLLNAGGYFELVRVGVSDEPLSVRFGSPIWQWLGDDRPGNRRFQLIFVTEEGDDEDGSIKRNPSDENAARITIKQRSLVGALIAELASAGVLDDEAVRRVHEAADAAWAAERLDLEEVDDVTERRLP